MILILTTSITPRIQYIFSLLLKEILGLEFSLITSREEWIAFQGPKFIYAKEVDGDALFIESSGLLFETGIFPHELKTTMQDGIPVLFLTENRRSALPFDPFAAAFYMVSRYEEYHREKKDKYGRFMVSESIAWKGKFFDMPVVHHWTAVLESVLVKHFPGIPVRHTQYCFIPTIDIDHAYAYRGRKLTRSLGGIGRSLVNADFAGIILRTKVLWGLARDPYDNYDYICRIHKEYGLMPLFFILFADYGGNDNQISLKNKDFRKLLRTLDQVGSVGIHPSLSSNRHMEKLISECRGLSDVLDRDVVISRQHFLKISFPKTYLNLIQKGITDDYSMGYASHIGFRAGIAIPYFFFDLSRNEASNFRIHPVAVMDVTLKEYLRLNPQQAKETIRKVIQKIKSVNGTFVSIWHNESLSDIGRWKDWRAVYEALLREATGQASS